MARASARRHNISQWASAIFRRPEDSRGSGHSEQTAQNEQPAGHLAAALLA